VHACTHDSTCSLRPDRRHFRRSRRVSPAKPASIHQLSRPATANHTCEWTRVCASLLDRSLHQIKACRAQCYLSSPWTSCATLSPHVRTLELNAPTKSMAESYSHTTTTDRLVRPSSCLRSPTPSMRPTTRRLLRRDHVKRADEHWPQGPTRASLS
jgi:hypothetical protein